MVIKYYAYSNGLYFIAWLKDGKPNQTTKAMNYYGNKVAN